MLSLYLTSIIKNSFKRTSINARSCRASFNHSQLTDQLLHFNQLQRINHGILQIHSIITQLWKHFSQHPPEATLCTGTTWHYPPLALPLALCSIINHPATSQRKWALCHYTIWIYMCIHTIFVKCLVGGTLISLLCRLCFPLRISQVPH